MDLDTLFEIIFGILATALAALGIWYQRRSSKRNALLFHLSLFLITLVVAHGVLTDGLDSQEFPVPTPILPLAHDQHPSTTRSLPWALLSRHYGPTTRVPSA